MRRKGRWKVGLREVIESTYRGEMTVYRRFAKVENGRTVFGELAVYTGVPCALSRGGSTRRQGTPIRQEETGEIRYDEKIFASPELTIPAGCRIVVVQDGVLREFAACGEATVYSTHQEIAVTREERA